MIIRPSAAIRQNYNEIADLCRKTAEPIFLTKNGEGDLVVMDIETYNRWEKMLKLREELLAVEEDRIAGRNGCTLEELDAYLDDVIRAIVEARTSQNMTQKELAERTGINQADISKLENGTRNPSVNLLKRLVEGMGMALKIEFVPKQNICK